MIEYRGFNIQPSEWFPGKFDFFMDGGKCTVADSIEEAKREIDETYMYLRWAVKIPFADPVYFKYLSEAMIFLNKVSGSYPLFEFNAM
jgi:hypothetical protein